MKGIEELDITIARLELKRRLQEEDLKEELRNIKDSLRPSQLLKRGFAKITGNSLGNNSVGTTMALVTGQLVKNVFVRSSGSIVVRAIGGILKRVVQFGLLRKQKGN